MLTEANEPLNCHTRASQGSASESRQKRGEAPITEEIGAYRSCCCSRLTPAGAHTLDATAYDPFGNAKTVSIPVTIGNATLVGSTHQARFRDAGLRPATALEYRVVGYDTRGRVVQSYGGCGQTAAGPKPITLRLPIAGATIDSGLDRGQYEGRSLVRAARPTGQPGQGKGTFTVDIPTAGDYAVWFYGRSRRPGVSTSAAVDRTTSSVVFGRYVDPLLIPGLDREQAAPWLVQRLVLQPRASAGPRQGEQTSSRYTIGGKQTFEFLELVRGRFDGLTAGQTYVVTVNSQRYTFSMPSRVITLVDNLADVNFTADQ